MVDDSKLRILKTPFKELLLEESFGAPALEAFGSDRSVENM